MRQLFLACLVLLLGGVLPVQAEVLVDELSQVVIESPEAFSISDYTNQFRLAQGQNIQVERVYRIGQPGSAPFVDVLISRMPPVDLLEQVQLRLINPQSRQNREFMSVSSVSIEGTSFSDGSAQAFYLIPGPSSSIAVFAYQPASPLLPAFLNSLRKSTGLEDIQGHPLQEDIEGVLDLGVFSGTRSESGQAVFLPEDEITRAALVKVTLLMAMPEEQIQSLSDQLLLNADQQTFSDVPADAWFAPYIRVAAAQGLVTGYDDGTFRPANPVNLAEAIKLVVQVLEPALSPGEDIWYEPYVRTLSDASLLIGSQQQYRLAFSDQFFQLYETATRSQVAAFINRFLVSQDSGVYGRVLSPEQLPLRFPKLSLDTVLEIDSGLPNTLIRQRFVLDTDQGIFELQSFDPALYTISERDQALPEDLQYLTETRSEIFSLSGSEHFHPVLLTAEQDLLRFTDDNVGIQFFHADALRSDIQRSGNEAFLRFYREGEDQELFSLNLFPPGSELSSAFQGRTALRSVQIGYHQWYLYPELSKSRLDLVSEGDTWLMVMSIPGSESLEQVSGKVLRVLRTLTDL